MTCYTFSDITGEIKVLVRDEVADYLRNVAEAIDSGNANPIDLGFSRLYLYI